ncbi:MAG: hypothetical protein R3F11_19955 [Verrucomicrobiales bacterium]
MTQLMGGVWVRVKAFLAEAHRFRAAGGAPGSLDALAKAGMDTRRITDPATAPIVLGAALVAGSIALDSLAADLSQHRGPNTDGTTAEKLSASRAERWRAETPLGFSSFSVADGKAYNASCPRGRGQPDGGPFPAPDANTGKEAWFTPLTFANTTAAEPGAKGTTAATARAARRRFP